MHGSSHFRGGHRAGHPSFIFTLVRGETGVYTKLKQARDFWPPKKPWLCQISMIDTMDCAKVFSAPGRPR